MKDLLHHLYAGHLLTTPQAHSLLLDIGRGQNGPEEISALFSAINMRPVHLPELRGFRDAMLELATPLDLEGRRTIDIVGTGGDGKNTFNISTLACVVVAAAGYPVTKHGSYGVSSSVGSSDVLIALGYEFTNDADELRRRLDRDGICFLHAPLFHPAMKQVVPVRKALRVRTFFNIMGPLLNPARPTYQLFGTFSAEVQRLYDYLLQEEADREYAIVHALDGYDEVSLTGTTAVRSSRGQRRLLPADFGLERLDPTALHGGETAEEGKRIFLSVLDGTATAAQTDVVCANAGLAIQVMEPEWSLPDCVAAARGCIADGRALKVLNAIVR